MPFVGPWPWDARDHRVPTWANLEARLISYQGRPLRTGKIHSPDGCAVCAIQPEDHEFPCLLVIQANHQSFAYLDKHVSKGTPVVWQCPLPYHVAPMAIQRHELRSTDGKIATIPVKQHTADLFPGYRCPGEKPIEKEVGLSRVRPPFSWLICHVGLSQSPTPGHHAEPEHRS